MPFRNTNILITGGAGFIGSNLAIRLVNKGANVTLLDSFIPEYGGDLYNISTISDKIKLNISEIRDSHAMRYLVQGQDYLFNLAGQTSHMDSMTNPFTDMEINTRAQLSILEACRHYNPAIRIVFAGTRQVYGHPLYLPVDEKHPVNPVDINGINKHAGESYHLLYNKVYGIRSTILRLTNTYGPRMRIKDERQTFVGIWIRCLLENKPFEVWGGEQLRDFTYVEDCISAMLLAAQQDSSIGKIYNLGGEKNISLLKLAEILIKANDERGAFTIRKFPESRKKIDIGDYYSDDSLIRQELGWNPLTSLEEGLKLTLTYFRKYLCNYIQ